MGIIENIQGGISRAIYKGIKHAGTAVAGVGAALLLKNFGFELAVEHQVLIATVVTGFLGTALKMVKDRFPKQFGWL